MIDIQNLHPNWRALRQNHMNQLRNMVNERHWQQAEARQLLEKAEREYKEIEAAVCGGKSCT